MKGVMHPDGWETAATDSLLRWVYLNQWAAKLFPWFKPTCSGNVLRRVPPSVN